MMTYELDMLLDTTANAMSLYSYTGHLYSLNVPPILNQYFEAVVRGKALNDATLFRQWESYSKRSLAVGGADILDTCPDFSMQAITSVHRACVLLTDVTISVFVNLPIES